MNTLLTRKSDYKWHIVYLSRSGKTKDKDIEIHLPGSKDAAQKAKTPKNV